MTFTKAVAGAVMVQGLALLGLPAAHANVILTYTGNDFTSFTPPLGSPGQPYTGTDKVTASITLANPLGDSFKGFVSPIAFTINDGVHTFTQSSILATHLFEFMTDPAGTIQQWMVQIVTPFSLHRNSHSNLP
jgi:hypothetical protein